MVKNFDEPDPSNQLPHPLSKAYASRCGFGAASQSLHTLNDIQPHNGQNVATEAGPSPQSRNIHNTPVAVDAPQYPDSSEKGGVQPIPPVSTAISPDSVAIFTTQLLDTLIGVAGRVIKRLRAKDYGSIRPLTLR